ncbi:hypothetical protein [Streptomyces sp. SM13]|uniref:hypothetical protein n=1 Tax=Streptomyces sp. SM13 TaxID=1983803 RepID=UPI0015E18E01|nr:hypothetical protein [Streptomyces sp. SM13]
MSSPPRSTRGRGNDSSSHLTLQFKDPETGVWTDIVLDDEDETSGYLGYTSVQAEESFSIDLRVSVAKKSPPRPSGGFFSESQPDTPSRLALDDALARTVYAKTAALLGVAPLTR